MINIIQNRLANIVLLLSVLVVLLPSWAASAPPHARVINGKETDRLWPWMVSLAYSVDDPAHTHFCGGVLIDKRFVLTAAHCVFDQQSFPQGMVAVIGKHDLTSTDGQFRGIEGIIIHPSFSMETLKNDLALLKLDADVDGVLAMQIATPFEVLTQLSEGNATIIGWGQTDPIAPIRPAKLQEATIPLIDGHRCSATLGLDFDPETMLCAGVLSSSAQQMNGVDACSGDSGGPLMIETITGWKLAGITSWGYACASERFWGVYTDASKFYEWIVTTRAVPPYNIVPPSIYGSPVEMEKIKCSPGEFGGDLTAPVQIRWLDYESGELISNKQTYQLRRKDIGRSLVCEVTVGDGDNSLIIQSEPAGPVYPSQKNKSRSVKSKGILKQAGIHCLGKNCSLLLSFRQHVDQVRGFISPSSCKTNACSFGRKWRIARAISATDWRIKLKASELSSYFYIHALDDLSYAFSFGFN